MPTTITLNGSPWTTEADPEMPLLWAIRDLAGLTGTKFGCGAAQCGACTVLVEGQPTRSCVTPVGSVDGQAVTTIEGLPTLADKVAGAVQKAWRDLDVVQCGYCQSGQIVGAVALLTANKKPTDAEVDEALNGNLCRCATYVRIRAAVHHAAKLLEA